MFGTTWLCLLIKCGSQLYLGEDHHLASLLEQMKIVSKNHLIICNPSRWMLKPNRHLKWPSTWPRVVTGPEINTLHSSVFRCLGRLMKSSFKLLHCQSGTQEHGVVLCAAEEGGPGLQCDTPLAKQAMLWELLVSLPGEDTHPSWHRSSVWLATHQDYDYGTRPAHSMPKWSLSCCMWRMWEILVLSFWLSARQLLQPNKSFKKVFFITPLNLDQIHIL